MSAPAAPAAQGPAEPEQSTLRKLFGVAQQAFIIWTVSQLATKYFFNAPPPQAAQSPAAGVPAVDPRTLPPVHANLAWPIGQQLDMHVHLSTSPSGDVFSSKWTSAYRKDQDEGLPSFVWQNITLGDYTEARVVEYNISFPPSVLRNGSLWADIFLAKTGQTQTPKSCVQCGAYPPLLTPHIPKLRVRKVKNLLKSNATEEPEEVEPDVITAHWHSNLTLALISDATVIPYSSLPPPIQEHIHLILTSATRRGQRVLQAHRVPERVLAPPLALYRAERNDADAPAPDRVPPMSFMKFQIFASMTQGFKEAAKNQGGGAGAAAELDEVKRMLLETNPWFLGLTGLVSLLHVLFEMLAFKSDVSHWRQKKEMVGVSVRTIITNVFVQFIILLYLIDNNDNTSWMILFGSGTGVLIEAWKITKAVDISVVAAPAAPSYHTSSTLKDEKKTQEYDKLAFRYVSYVAIPLLAAYTVYSLMYETHRGWYSFIISTLTSFVYMFGFAQLVPQLIINYKLKSVAHMPMKAMIYKTLSTVVDDFFAFCIKMPFLHRLACFRDDVVFLIFLYQRWIYRIDPKRVNEYGQVLALDVDAAGETKKDR
ncbi:cleft lip and palate associated transmembrane protein [Mycena leptocephala]|nr:cleft lip and palate associated transmembrane protein [Mycena leptocephala]